MFRETTESRRSLSPSRDIGRPVPGNGPSVGRARDRRLGNRDGQTRGRSRTSCGEGDLTCHERRDASGAAVPRRDGLARRSSAAETPSGRPSLVSQREPDPRAGGRWITVVYPTTAAPAAEGFCAGSAACGGKHLAAWSARRAPGGRTVDHGRRRPTGPDSYASRRTERAGSSGDARKATLGLTLGRPSPVRGPTRGG